MTQEEVIGQVVGHLAALGVPYMIADSFASNLHGVPRMTQDADVFIDADEPTILRLVRALEVDFYVSEEAAREAVHLFNRRGDAGCAQAGRCSGRARGQTGCPGSS